MRRALQKPVIKRERLYASASTGAPRVVTFIKTKNRMWLAGHGGEGKWGVHVEWVPSFSFAR